MKNYLSMSDEEFLQQQGTLQDDTAAESSTDVVQESVEDPGHVVQEDNGIEPSTQVDEDPGVFDETTTTASAPDDAQTPNQDASAQPSDNPEKDNQPTVTKDDVTQSTDYKAFHDKMMAPFVANGKTIQLQSVDEAIQLMQMGANYTRKMQSIAPHRKVLMMLENNGLLDEGKLSRLIDLDKKNPEAIRALVKEAGIDPLDIDVESDSTYVPGDHVVSDEAMAFQTTLEEVSSTPDGQETVRAITGSWDADSKAELWSDPSILPVIHQQRVSGVYDRVTAEIERQRTIGAIPPHVSFLNAYRVIGEHMTKAGAFNDLQGMAQAQTQAPAQEVIQRPVATRVASPRPAVSNSAKVGAAAPTRTATPKRTEAFINPLAMSDDEFMKQFANRV